MKWVLLRIFGLFKLLLWLMVPVALAVGGLYVYTQMKDWNQEAARIATMVQQATGRDFFIKGGVEFRFFPLPVLTVHDVRLDNLPGAAEDAFITAKTMQVTPSLLSLISGELAIADVTVIAPVIALELLPDGKKTWDMSSGEGIGAVAREAAPVRQITIKGGRLKGYNRATQFVTDLAGVEGVFTPKGPNGAFRFEGLLKRDQSAFSVLLHSSAGLAAAVIPLKLQLGEGASQINLEGEWRQQTNGGVEYQFAARGTVAPSSLPMGHRLAQVDAVGKPASVPLQATIKGTGDGFTVSGLKLEGEMLRGSGEATVRLAKPRPAFALNLLLERMDMAAEQLLPEGAQTLAPKPEEADVAGNPAFRVGAIGFGKYFEINLLQDVDVVVDVRVNEARFQNEGLRDVKLNVVSVQGGGLELRNFSATLPGETALEAKGSVTDDGTVSDMAARFNGNVRLYGDNLRQFLTWLKVDLPPIPEDKLNAFALSANAILSQREVAFPAIVARFDDTSITGGNAAVSNDPSKPSQLALTLDSLNLDLYLPKLEDLIQEAGGNKQEAQYEALNATIRKFDFLRVVNSAFGTTDLLLTLQNLTYKGQQVLKASSRIRFGSARLELSDIDVQARNVQFGGSIAIDAAGLKPKIEMDIEVQDFNTADIPELRLFLKTNQGEGSLADNVAMSERWSRDVLDMHELRAYDGKAKFFFRSFTHEEVVLENLNVQVHVQENFLYLDSIRATVFDGGKFDGKAILNIGVQPTLSLSFALSNASIRETLLQLLDVDEITEGRFSTSGSISTLGNDVRTLVSRLEGSLNLILRGAKIEGLDFRGLTESLARIIGKKEMTAILERHLRPDVKTNMYYDYAAGSVILASGVLGMNDLQLLSPNFPPLVVSGNVDLAQWKYDMLIKTGLPLGMDGGYQFRREASAGDVPLVGRIQGSIESPFIVWEKKPIESFWEKRFYR